MFKVCELLHDGVAGIFGTPGIKEEVSQTEALCSKYDIPYVGSWNAIGQSKKDVAINFHPTTDTLAQVNSLKIEE